MTMQWALGDNAIAQDNNAMTVSDNAMALMTIHWARMILSTRLV